MSLNVARKVKRKGISILMEEQLIEQIDELASVLETNKTEIIRAILEKYIPIELEDAS